VIDVTGDEPAERRGEVPPRAIVVPGTRPRTFPAGEYGLPCGLIVGYRGQDTERKIRLNDVLREFGLPREVQE
jgi:2,3,4,5-tetrahydropyridine-2-carboxylate N-succinyltransferase